MVPLISQFGWHEWLCKTNFSFLMGASHPHEVVERACQLGYRSLCINDLDGVYGLARSYLELKKIKQSGLAQNISASEALSYQSSRVVGLKPTNSNLKLHYSAEVHLQSHHEDPILFRHNVVLLAKNRDGYKNLCELLSRAHRESKDQSVLPVEEILNHSTQGMALIVPQRGLLRGGARQLGPDFWGPLREHFGGEVYMALTRLMHPFEDALIAPALSIIKKYQWKFLFSQDAFFHVREQKPLSDLLHAIRCNQTIDQCGAQFFPNEQRFLHNLCELEAIYRVFPQYRQGLIYSQQLSQSCDLCFSQLHYHYPKEMIPEGLGAQQYLEQLVWQGVRERFPQGVPGGVINTLKKELDLVAALNFADYFLTVWDIVAWARRQDILCQGRGSAANSVICYVLGITSVDPTQFDLLFERFMSMERGDPPDIDVDFEHERREEVIQYIYKRFGRDKAAMVANVITFKNKGALRAVGKAFGISEEILSQASKLVRSKYFRGKGYRATLQHIKEKYPQLQRPSQSQYQVLQVNLGKEISQINYEELLTPQVSTVPWDLWMRMAERLKGFPRHMGIHSGGFVISDQSLLQLCAIEPATMPGRTVVQWCKEDIEGLGFFKIDVLCLGMLTAVRKCFSLIQQHYGKELSMWAIPQEDEPTYNMIQKALTVGVFQIESRAQMSMLPRLKPKTFYDLVIEVAIIRPGPIQGGVIHPYLKRRDGLEPITFPDERLRPILSRTLGIAIFQEQAMRIAIAVGDFTAGEANELRKNIGAWNVSSFSRDINPWIDKLDQGMQKNRIPLEFREQILGQMRGFSDYGFPESHAVSFALIAYVSSYLKCHYPAAFFTALLNSQPMGFYSPHALLQAAKRDASVPILGVSLNHSVWDHRLELVEKAQPDIHKPPIFAIRLGFRVVNALSQSAVEELVKVRDQGGSFKDFDDFVCRTKIYRNDYTALAAADVFSELGVERKQALWKAEAVPTRPLVEVKDSIISWSEEQPFEKLQRDFASFNTSLGAHPVNIVKEKHWLYAVALKRIFTSKMIQQMAPNYIVDSFGMVLIKQAPPSAKGMVFVTMEDETGFINLAFSPQVYDLYYEVIENSAFLCVQGKVQRQGHSHSILVKKVWSPELKATVVALDESTNSGEVLPPDGAVVRELQKPRSYF